jgi:DNA-binding Lrp family transcriptional regulator
MNDMDKPAKLELDELDLMLTKELELDARQSIRVLSRKLGVTEITVRKRMLALLDRKVITIAVFTNPYSFGYCADFRIPRCPREDR